MKRGWCPSLSAPMQAQDGWIVRLKPFAGILSAKQATLIADLAAHYGNGQIELTSRGNLQLRGIRDAAGVAREARAGGIAPDDPAADRLNLAVSPLAGLDDECAPETHVMARAVAERALPLLPSLPDKFGFAVDGGGCAPVTGDAVLRFEHGAWCVAGQATADPVEALLTHAGSLAHSVLRRPRGAAGPPLYGAVPGGYALGFAFGALDIAQWRAAVDGATEIRVTPWRALVRVGGAIPALPMAMTDPHDPRLRVAACIGPAGCAKAHADVRATARALAARVPQGALLHVAGCAKGCACPGAAAFVAVAEAEGYGLIRNGRAGDPPERYVAGEAALVAWLAHAG